MNDAQREALARDLAKARLAGTLMAKPQLEVTSKEAYDLQERVSQLLDSTTIGWKVGSTSAEAQARLGTDEPGAGRLLERFAYASGAAVPVSAAHDVQVEVEFAFAMARRLAGLFTMAVVTGGVLIAVWG